MIGLLPNAHSKDMNHTCQKMLRLLADPRGWKIGKTKVYSNFTYKVFSHDVTAAMLVSQTNPGGGGGERGGEGRGLELFLNVNIFLCSNSVA